MFKRPSPLEEYSMDQIVKDHAPAFDKVPPMPSQVTVPPVEQGEQDEAYFRAKPDGAADPAGEVGWYLAQERLRRGLDLQQASEVTGIHPYHIFAIEHGEMTHMPPRLEALEMVAGYATFLGFDPEPLLQHYVTFIPAPQLAPKTHPADPAPMTSAKILKFGKFVPKLKPIDLKSLKLPSMATFPGGQTGIVASLAGAFILFAGTVWMMTGQSGPQPEPIDIALNEPAPAIVGDPMPTATTGTDAADVSVTESPLAGASVATAAPVQPEQPQAIAPPVAMTETPTPVAQTEDLGAFIQQKLGDETAASSETTQTLTPAPAPVQVAAADGHVFGSPDAAARLVLKAKDRVWVRIEDAQGRVLMTQELQKGDEYRVPDQAGLTVIAKDGGLLSYVIDGQDKGLLGAPGKILANEKLDIKALEARG
jgi:cytoskeleton protein RodZ